MKERAYAELAEYFDSSSAIVKAKINALRAILGREMEKESKTKSGQATDEMYVSKWMFYEQLKFLRPVIATTKSRDSISTQNNDLDDSVSLLENETPLKKKNLKTIIAEGKLELLKRCAESMAPGSSAKEPTHFALLVEEKLGRLSQKNRMIAEKRIMDILFEIEINEFEGGFHQVVKTNQSPAIQINQLPNQPALHMNQHISTQPNANIPYPSRKSTPFHMNQMFSSD